MKILLLNPPFVLPNRSDQLDVKKSFFVPPLGLASITAYLRQNGFDVTLMDLFDYSWEEVERLIDNQLSKVDIFGITCVTCKHLHSKELADVIKKKKPNATIIMGGPHVTYLDEQVVKYFPVDYVVRGEGEETIVELLMSLKLGKSIDSVRGLTYKKNGIVTRSPAQPLIANIDSLPFPDFTDLDLKRYIPYLNNTIIPKEFKMTEPVIPLSTTRGCPYECNFCSSSLVWGRKVRFRSAERIVDEIEGYTKKGNRFFMINDDTFTLKPERVNQFCKLIIEKKLDIKWTCAARVHPISMEMLDLMKKTGCLFIYYGVESGSEAVLKNIGKKIEIKHIINAFDLTKEVGIDSAAFIMVGNPGETNKTITETIHLVKRTRPGNIILSKVAIFPGTGLEKLAKDKRFISDDYWLNHDFAPFFTLEHSFEHISLFADRIYFYHKYYQKKYINAFKVIFSRTLRLLIEALKIKNLLIPLKQVKPIKKFWEAIHDF